MPNPFIMLHAKRNNGDAPLVGVATTSIQSFVQTHEGGTRITFANHEYLYVIEDPIRIFELIYST